MKFILVDDEPLALDYLEYQLRKICKIQSIWKFTDPVLAKDTIVREKADAVFLDIQMPEVDGISFADQLLESNPGLPIVFVTAYNEYAVQAFEMNALDYVMKPVGTDRLRNTIARLQSQAANEAPAASADRSIRLKLFYEVLIESEGGEFAPIRWRTAKAQELFLYLLQNRDKLVRKDALIDLLWPEFEAGKAYPQLYTCIYHIRKTLAPFGDHFTISNISEGYMLQLNQVRLDVEEWEEGIKNGTEIAPEELASYDQLMSLYKGDYLQDFDYWWAESERERLKLMWIRRSFRLAESYRAAGQTENAIAKYAEICERSPAIEEAHFALMNLYAELHLHQAVHRQYRQLASVMRDEINDQPSTYIQEWYQQWSQQQKE